ncbi:LacI family DNA-binding transcriptional regulator [Sinomonas sp. P47F7]|uniref:LacI family DNA-binding transcriptional regulator n=1 Tax=Sinomonas sp. P47F7 TaxID=3410987 RepID=UPI003BF536DA
MRAPRDDRPPTIHDVAREAGVSLPTVSRVLTGSTPVSKKRRDQVLAAMKRLGYRPNGAARALVQGRQPIIGIVTPDVTYGSAQMVRSAERAARNAGYVVTVSVIDPYDLTRADTSLDVLLAQPIVGVIVLDFDRYDLKDLAEKLAGLPVSTISSGGDDHLRHVVVDDRRAARELTEHLLALGHKTVHHVSFPGPHGHPHPRELGWRDALIAAGVPVPTPIQIDPTLEGDQYVRAGRPSVNELLRDPSLTAVFCGNDQIAFGVMRGLTDAGLSVPQDVSVAGIDDEPLAEFWGPALTTYRLDFDWAGAAALRALLQPEETNERAASSTFGLVVRDSTTKPKG